MNISHDRSYISPASEKWVTRGYARADFDCLRIQYIYTEEPQSQRYSVTPHSLVLDAQNRNAVMVPVMAAIAGEFICYQYEPEDPAPYGSSSWELFFWCNDFSNTLHGHGLSGRDYSYFTLSFNSAQTVEQRAAVCSRVLQFLETRFHSNPNLEVVVQYSIWYDKKKIEADAKKAQHLLDGCQYTYGSKEGKFFVENGQLLFHPKYARKYNYRVDYPDILSVCWELDLTPNITTSPASKPIPALNGHGSPTVPYEQSSSTHPIQVSALCRYRSHCVNKCVKEYKL